MKIRAFALVLAFGLSVPREAVAVYDTKTGISSESTSERMSREAQETKDWVNQWSGANLPGNRGSSGYGAPRGLDQGPTVAQRIDAENAAREARIQADRARHEQWEREAREAANRRALEQEFAEEAARTRALQQQWEDAERKRIEFPWLRARERAKAQGREMKLSLDEFRAHWDDLGKWSREADSNRESALRLAHIELNGTYGAEPSPLRAKLTFTKHGFVYLTGIATYFVWNDIIFKDDPPESLARTAAMYRELAYKEWKQNVAMEKDPLSQKRLAVGLLALRLRDLPVTPVSQEAQLLIARVLHRALAAQHEPIARHHGPLSGEPTDGVIWLDAPLARVLWDTFAARPDAAPCGATMADLRRILTEAEDPFSREPLTFYSSNLADWTPQGAMPAFEPKSDALDTLMLAALGVVHDKIGPTIELLAVRTETGPSIEASRDSVVGALFHRLIEDRLPSEPLFRALARRCWELVEPSFAEIPPAKVKANAASSDDGLLHAQLKQIIRLATETWKNDDFFAEVEEVTHLKSGPEISARAVELVARLKEAPGERVSRVELVLLAIKHTDLLDDATVAEAAFQAVKQPGDEMLLIPELRNSGPIKDRYLAVLRETEEAKRHPFFWAALTREQVGDPGAACDMLLALSPLPAEAIDLAASYVSGRYWVDPNFQYKLQLDALALPAQKQRFSTPRETLEMIYQDMTMPSFEAAGETEAVQRSREVLEGNPDLKQRQKALSDLVALQRDFDARNVPNETPLKALENATLKDPDGDARSAFVDALRSSPAWSALSEERRLSKGKTGGWGRPEARFGTWERRRKGWHLLLASLMKQELWAAKAIEALSLREAREQLRDLISSDFGDSFHEGNLVIQAFLATQDVTSSESWRERLKTVTPLTEARDVTRLLSRGVSEPWSLVEGEQVPDKDRYSTEDEACVDCLVEATEGVYRRTLQPGYESDTPPAEEWGQKEVYEALAQLGPRFKKPARWNDADQGRFSPECLTLLFADHWEFLAKQPKGSAIAHAFPKLSIEEAVLGADSLMRVRGSLENLSLKDTRDYDFGVDLLNKALEKVPDGAALAKRMADEEIGPKDLLARLRELKEIP